ncbi:MAG: 4'-phosphopantetheinyl transferase superfamily protein [Alphaproteobacteria bacterium]|nr:4'-phosphopantetheinyl transferase superfamily protein [Alphaproteobacteria bacterium]
MAPDEIARASRLKSPKLGARFVAARGLLRRILGSQIGCPPARLVFQVSPTGKPSLRHDDLPVPHFNISHSGNLGAVAISRDARVGIDIEQLREVTEGVAERFFSADEIAKLDQLHGEQRQQAFFRCWTRKEAFLKATGEGIARGLDSFSVSLGATEKPCILSIDGDETVARDWQLFDLSPARDYAGALVVGLPVAAPVELKLHQVNESD